MKKLFVLPVLLLMSVVVLALAAPAGAAATGRIAVCVTDSTGANVPLTGGFEQAWVKTGSTASVGPVGVSGCRESEFPAGTNVEVWAGTQHTYSDHRTGVVPDGTTLEFHFYTTNVTLQYRSPDAGPAYDGDVAYGGSYGDEAWFKQTPATASKELLSDGVNAVHFRLSGTGGANGRLGLLWPVATGTGATFTRSLIALRLVDSNGDPLNGGTARYQYGYWSYAPGSTGSEPASASTFADGILAYAVSGLAHTVTNEMRFSNTKQTVTQDASANSVYQFQTRLLTLRLETCGGDPLDGARARYGNGSSYWTWWFPGGGGYTGTSAPGETAAQVFPGTYSFEMQYQGTADRKLSVVVPDADTMLTWQTTSVTLSWGGSISYGGSTGNSRWFTKPTMELLPGTYTFHFRDIGSTPGATVDLTFGGCSFAKTLVIARLLDHTGAGIPGGVVDYAPGGSWLAFGTTDSSGVAALLADGTLGTIKVRMGYHNGSQIQQENASTHPVFTFQTVQATIRLTDHNGDPLENGSVQQGGGSWIPVGPTDSSGNAYFEAFPGTYKFKMTYNAGSQEMTQDISSPVVFQTGAVHSDTGTATQYAMGSWQPFTQNVELLPGNWHFSFDAFPITYYDIYAGMVNHIH